MTMAIKNLTQRLRDCHMGDTRLIWEAAKELDRQQAVIEELKVHLTRQATLLEMLKRDPLLHPNGRTNEDGSPVVTEAMVRRFLSWSLPNSVCADRCATDPNYPYTRSGTNLLNAKEAREMLEHVIGANPSAGESLVKP